jgi:hypothetical protein
MVKIENITCDSTLDARTWERYWYEKLNANMNTNRPMRTSEEAKKYATEWSKASQASKRLYCEACDCYHRRSNIVAHNKTKKHLANTAQIQN